MKKSRSYLKATILLALALFSNFMTRANVGKVEYYYEAEKLFNDGAYHEAALAYEKYISSEKELAVSNSLSHFVKEKKMKRKVRQAIYQDAVYHLAESYRLSHDYINAEKYYQEAMGFKSADLDFPELVYWYGVTLRANQKYDEATKAFTDFIASNQGKQSNKERAKKQLVDLQFVKTQLDKAKDNEIVVRPNTIPGQASSFALAIEHGDTVAFTSINAESKMDKNGKTTYTYHHRLYESVVGANLLENKKAFPFQEDGMENGQASFSKDGKRMFFTKWGMLGNKKRSVIYQSTKTDNGWSVPVKMAEPVNALGYDSEQPFITPDSKYLLFSSNRPGGQGGYDIWYVDLSNNSRVITAHNMGKKINTAGDECSPFYNAANQTLIFASNGLVGMGGFDIYAAKGNADFSDWEKPVNPGAPINSVKDDMYYISTNDEHIWERGWLSSDRNSDYGLALFSIGKNITKKVYGTIVDAVTKKPLAGALIVVSDERQPTKVLLGKTTDNQGRYEFELQNVSKFILHVEKEGFVEIDHTYASRLESTNDSIQNETISLERTKDKQAEELLTSLKSVKRKSQIGNFKFEKTSLNKAAKENLDSLASIMEKFPTIKVQLNGYTDKVGSAQYNLKLSQERVNACIEYLTKLGIDKDRLIGKGYGEASPIAAEKINGKDNPSGRAKNRRVEYVLILDDLSNE